MVTRPAEDGEGRSFEISFTNMGGYMQPQGHLQLVLWAVLFGLDPQQCVDMPRFCIGPDNEEEFWIEGLTEPELGQLRAKGHKPKKVKTLSDAFCMGRAQMIVKHNGVLWGGSDKRGDGCAVGY